MTLSGSSLYRVDHIIESSHGFCSHSPIIGIHCRLAFKTSFRLCRYYDITVSGWGLALGNETNATILLKISIMIATALEKLAQRLAEDCCLANYRNKSSYVRPFIYFILSLPHGTIQNEKGTEPARQSCPNSQDEKIHHHHHHQSDPISVAFLPCIRRREKAF